MGIVCSSTVGLISVCHHKQKSRVPLPLAPTIVALLLACAGCQVQAVSSTQLQIHQALVDRDGLTALRDEPDLKVTCAPPAGWDRLPLKQTSLYLHQQWRSIDRRAGFGVAYIHLPIPLPPQMVLWFAKNQYVSTDKNPGNANIISEWTDSLGRHWFEGENDLYHVRGYAMTRGLGAWLVYSGYRMKSKPNEQQLALAAKAAESVALAAPEGDEEVDR